jgi:hypothetical protein
MTKCTATGRAPENAESAPVPTDRKLADGQHADHWVLCETERAKGYVRPLRMSYVHVGIVGPQHETRNLTAEEQERYGDYGYVKFEIYPLGFKGSSTGRFWTQEQLDKIGKGCGTLTTMPRACAETYAREPGYYGSTFCCGCQQYLPVGAAGEFVWDASDERVGT